MYSFEHLANIGMFIYSVSAFAFLSHFISFFSVSFSCLSIRPDICRRNILLWNENMKNKWERWKTETERKILDCKIQTVDCRFQFNVFCLSFCVHIRFWRFCTLMWKTSFFLCSFFSASDLWFSSRSVLYISASTFRWPNRKFT